MVGRICIFPQDVVARGSGQGTVCGAGSAIGGSKKGGAARLARSATVRLAPIVAQMGGCTNGRQSSRLDDGDNDVFFWESISKHVKGGRERVRGGIRQIRRIE